LSSLLALDNLDITMPSEGGANLSSHFVSLNS
jgi:hypothetical protein